MDREKLRKLRANHARRYDALDGVHWGCVCGAVDCERAALVEALDKAEREAISARADLKREMERNEKAERQLGAELAGAEHRIKRLKQGAR